MPKLKFKLPAIESENLSLLCGPVNTNLNQIEQSLEVKIKSRGNSFSISGEKNNVIKSRLIIEDLATLAKSRDSVSADEVHFSIRRALNGATKDNNGQIFELKKEKDKLKELAKDGLKVEESLLDEKKVRDNYNTVTNMLRDTGIKSTIIKKYLPIMNQLINRYLKELDFYVSFELDENFMETIKSRFRDEFSYASFSEGEKMRIDLALLFTWRTIAKMKNSANTNLLILDEIFDSSLDTSGTDDFLKILHTVSDKTNVFVISHKTESLQDKFASTLKVEKKQNFSVISKEE